MNNRVIHFEIQADDVSRASDFYKKVLGWEFTQAMKKEEAGMDYWTIKTGEEGTPGINGGMYMRPAEGEKFHTYDCTVMVENIDKTIDDFKANGGTIRLTNGQEKSQIPGVG